MTTPTHQAAEPAPSEPLRHSTKDTGDCPHWCRACKAEAEQRALAASPAPLAEGGDMVLVPREPTESMWGHLARDIVWFLYSTAAPHYGSKFHEWARNMGRELPEWLVAEIPDVKHSPAKGTWAVCIYKAMLAAAPPAPTPGTLPDEVASLLKDAYRALHDLLEDTQHADHQCSDPKCPVDFARRIDERLRAAIAAQAVKG